jgi:alkyl sulfatase BDS1-like metallo-beta-lactamase superfamily hydrolase
MKLKHLVLPLITSAMAFGQWAMAYEYSAKPKPPSKYTDAANAALLKALPFNDKQSFEDATRNKIADLPDKGVVKNAKGEVVWDLSRFDFLAGDKPAPDTVNPSLWRQAQIMQRNAGLFKVTDGIYQVRGLDITNCTIIEGKTGLIVMDCLMSKETAKAAMDLYFQHRPQKPIKAILFSHSHIDHYGGVLGVVPAEDIKSGKVKLYAPEGFTSAALDEAVIGGNRQMRLTGYQYSALVERSPTGAVTSGLGLDVSTGETTFAVPNVVIKDSETVNIDGLDFEFMQAPDTEAPAEMFFYIPQYKALCTAEDAVFTLHNVYTLRGAKPRSAYNWAKFLQAAREKWGGKAEVLYAPHHWPLWGVDNIDQHIKRTAAAYKFIDNQTVRLANSGYNMVEAAEMIQNFPGALGKDWALRGYYGTINHDVKAAFDKHFGWYDGNPATLHPLPRVEAGKRFVEYMGGADAILEKAQKDYDKGDYRWVAQVLTKLVYAEPDNMKARYLLADAFEQMGYQAEAGTWRGWYLSGAKDLREGVKKLPVVVFASASTIEAEPLDLFFDYLAVRLDPEKVVGKHLTMNFDFTDTQEKWLLEVEWGVLTYYKGKQSKEADVTVTLTRADLNKILLGKTKVETEIMSGNIKVSGKNPEAFDEFLAALVTFDGWYQVVMPIGTK